MLVIEFLCNLLCNMLVIESSTIAEIIFNWQKKDWIKCYMGSKEALGQTIIKF
jgi:hypothetical protein